MVTVGFLGLYNCIKRCGVDTTVSKTTHFSVLRLFINYSSALLLHVENKTNGR